MVKMTHKDVAQAQVCECIKGLLQHLIERYTIIPIIMMLKELADEEAARQPKSNWYMISMNLQQIESWMLGSLQDE